MDVSFKKFLVSAFIVLTLSNFGFANQISFFASGGPNFSNLKNNRLVAIDEVLTNAYYSQNQTNTEFFGAVGASHTFENTVFSSFKLSLGVAGYFFRLGDVKGTEYPFVNEGLFDTLRYGFHARSNSLMVEAKAIYSAFALKPYALIGVGPSWNKFYDYHEEPNDSSLSASPAMPFTDRTKQTVSYELGAGLQYLLWDDQQRQVQYHASAGYQYFNLDTATLGPSAAQTSSARLKVKNLYTQAVIFTLAVSFGQ
ncbi:hypothetical protein [Legionella jordanis]|uniref:Outer membrane protein beta-barrel domain-containing protein n=1 Tax=Legionella jordanis TaxID=456 RepID=A0A0W0V8A2_9GAMM|nr:hypothetical protein [Legionella jordanis]KTD16375.1 hypothetical protein Ljor_0681 [Legionella jordanis]RMX04415.1 hypothetical protein EAW55_02980 [Legionella jordanis]VEH12165.1 Uncharacterised protein [Legionella jordanis]HAT8715098.1 hypothetical protein [Legionella jordanis]